LIVSVAESLPINSQ